jgi:large subunit ribosomal protein L22
MADEQRKDAKKPAAKRAPAKKAPAKASAKRPAAKKEAPKKEAKRAAAKKAKAPTGKETSKRVADEKPAEKKATPKKAAAPAPKPAPLVVRASSRYVRVAPRKARLVADQVRGLQIERARALLQFSPRSVAHDIRKLIDSAASNAENNHDLVADEMRVAEITVDEGPTLKRYRPRAQGRATPIHKRTSHIAVALTPEED